MPPGHQRAPTALPHRPLRRCGPRPGFALLASASPWRPYIAPDDEAPASAEPERTGPLDGYRPWAELLARTFAVDVPPGEASRWPKARLRAPQLSRLPGAHDAARGDQGVREQREACPRGIARYLAHVGEMTEVPRRSPDRGPPHWKSRVLRLQALGNEEESSQSQGYGGDEAAWPEARRRASPATDSEGLPAGRRSPRGGRDRGYEALSRSETRACQGLDLWLLAPRKGIQRTGPRGT